MSPTVESAGYELSNAQFERFRTLLEQETGIALRDEKRQLVCTRLARRLRELKLATFEEYLHYVTHNHHVELEQLVNAMTTNKTAFYREAHHFELLARDCAGPKLRAAGKGPLKLRVWSAGCSTGEEVYTCLITLLDAIPQWESCDIRALASDIDTNVLSVGERAVYSAECLKDDVPREVAARWFIKGQDDQQGKVRIRRALRERVAFRQINFVAPSWPVHTKFDAIFCRNALIYFDITRQQQIVARLVQYLEPGGLLFLGHSESIAGVRPDLTSLGRTSYRYQAGAT